MRRIKVLSLFLITLLLVLAGCSSSNNGEKESQKITGKIVLVGNMPFTKLALMTAPDKKYVLNCDKAMHDSLLSYQGRNAEISYDKMNDSSGIGVVSVKEVKFK